MMPAPAVVLVPSADIEAHLRNCKTFSIAVAGAIFRVQHGSATVQPDGYVEEYSMHAERRIELDRIELRALVGRRAYTVTLSGIGNAVFEVRELDDYPVNELTKKKDRKVLLCA